MINKNTKEYIESKKSAGLYGLSVNPALHPGETLKDEIEFVGLTQADVAARAGCTIQTINRIVNGRESISPDMALKLERVFEGRPNAQFWLNMQSAYDNEAARVREEQRAEEEIGFFQSYMAETFKELQGFGLFGRITLETKDDLKKAVLEVKDFFEVATLESIHEKNILGVAFRKYDRKNLNEYNLAALIKSGEKKARKVLKDQSLKMYDEKKFLAELPRIKTLTEKKPVVFLNELQERCREFGVIVVYVPQITHTYFGGATTWVSGHPVIILKAEKQWEDIFWFNFFHEAGHILKHSKKKFFIDFENGKKTDLEIEADEFAQKILIPDFETMTEGLKPEINIELWLKTSARLAKVSEGIIAGRVCNEVKNKNAWKILGKYRPTIKEKVTLLD
ncbi:MAG: HigA family addiction module antitoxin [Candidatus Paceibacterota bacterium]